MSLVFVDGFNQHELSNDKSDIEYKWSYASGGSVKNDTPRNNDPLNKYFEMPYQYSNTHYLRKSFPTPFIDGIIMGWCAKNHGYQIQIDIGVDNDSNQLLTFNFPYDSNIKLHRVRAKYLNSSGTITTIETNDYIIDNTIWEYLEFKIVYTNTNDANLVFRLNGQDLLNVLLHDIQDCRNNINNIQFKNRVDARDSIDYGIDDFYVCNLQGTDNNDFLGDIAIQNIRPNAAGLISNFTPVGETYNYECVNSDVNDELTYIESDVINNTELFNLDDITASSQAKILGVVNNLYCKKTDAGNRILGHVISNGTNTHYDAGDIILDSGIKIYDKPWDINPLTSQPFTISDVNSLQCGLTIKS